MRRPGTSRPAMRAIFASSAIERRLRVEPARRVDEHRVDPPRPGRLERVEHDGRGIGALAMPHDLDARPLGPPLELVDRRRAKRVGRHDHHRAPGGALASRRASRWSSSCRRRCTPTTKTTRGDAASAKAAAVRPGRRAARRAAHRAARAVERSLARLLSHRRPRPPRSVPGRGPRRAGSSPARRRRLVDGVGSKARTAATQAIPRACASVRARAS